MNELIVAAVAAGILIVGAAIAGAVTGFRLGSRRKPRRLSTIFTPPEPTPEHVDEQVVRMMVDNFDALSWHRWTEVDHEGAEQYNRMEQAAQDKALQVLDYDPDYRLAKVQGKTGVYLTSGERCSCPDYRKRQLPCKHMYLLAMELDSDAERRISSSARPLNGLSFALAGRFADTDGLSIRQRINQLGGTWSDEVRFDSSAVVVGSNPSAAKMQRSHEFDAELVPEDALIDVFQLD